MSVEWVPTRPVVPFALEVETMAAARDGRPDATRHRSASSERAAVGSEATAFDRARELESIDVSLLDYEERAVLAAHQRAEEKVALYREFAKVGPIAGLLLLFVFPIGVIFTLYQVWRLARRSYQTLIEPGVRDRLVAEEVGKRLDERVHAQRRAMESEHARSLEKLSASIAHEIRNPITAAKSLVQQMGEEPAASDNIEYARVALAELERVERSVSHLLRFARDEELRGQEVLLADVVDSALETFRDRIARTGVSVERSYDTDGAMWGDPEKLRRIAINLIGNAIDAVSKPQGQSTFEPRVELALGENLAGSEVWLRVRDNGSGIEEDAAARIFDPFFSEKESGTGLGLSITRKLVDAHGGEIELETESGHGTEFLVIFPRQSGGARR